MSNNKPMVYRGFKLSPLDTTTHGGRVVQNLRGMRASLDGPRAFVEKRRSDFIDA